MGGVASPYLIAILAGWLAAQGLKYVIKVAQTRSLNHFRQLYSSGSMPSAHSTIVVAIVVIAGLSDGVNSAVFGIAALLALIVMYDAVMVRRSSGEQGLALRALILEQNSTIPLPRAAQGHTPVEVLAGLVLGMIVGVVVFLATR